MADPREVEHVRERLNRLSGRLERAAKAARLTNALWTLDQATWEPHDWSTF